QPCALPISCRRAYQSPDGAVRCVSGTLPGDLASNNESASDECAVITAHVPVAACLAVRTAPRRLSPCTRTQLRPAPLAAYSAWSADFMTSSGLRCVSRRSATPMLTVTETEPAAPLPRRCRP